MICKTSFLMSSCSNVIYRGMFGETNIYLNPIESVSNEVMITLNVEHIANNDWNDEYSYSKFNNGPLKKNNYNYNEL